MEVSFSSPFKRAFKKRIKGNVELEARFWQKLEQFTLTSLCNATNEAGVGEVQVNTDSHSPLISLITRCHCSLTRKLLLCGRRMTSNLSRIRS